MNGARVTPTERGGPRVPVPVHGAPADGDTSREATPERLRRALGHFASGVTVVTTTSGGPERPQAHGMTANAFTSVSLDPPLVLVSISTEAHTHRRIARTGRYGVSILRGEQEPLSQHFAGGAQSPELARFVWRDGLPLLAGALVHLSCRVRQTHRAGDHTLFIGEVEGLWCGSGAPLVHYRRSLHTLAVDQPAPAPPTTPADTAAASSTTAPSAVTSSGAGAFGTAPSAAASTGTAPSGTAKSGTAPTGRPVHVR